MRPGTAFLIACALVGCAGASSPRSEPHAPLADAGPAPAPDAAAPPSHAAAPAKPFHPDDDAACGELATLSSELRMWQVAASPQPHWKKASALWPTLPAACRGGTWYLAAAELASRPANAVTSADGAVTVTSPADALARALAAEPDHPALLAHLAFADDLVPGQAPALPADACTTARARGGADFADDIAYVCALAAIRGGDAATALTELDRISSVNEFPDLQARRAQALALSGKSKDARALVKPATAAITNARPRFDLTLAAKDALKKKLSAL
jgi:hypothetical protein